MSIVAFIPVRCGSKGIPMKNIKLFCGKPLVYWVLKAAESVHEINKIVVSTDCDEIESVVNNLNIKKVEIHRRLAENAADTASTESVMLEYINYAKLAFDDEMILIQATSPFTTSEHLKKGIETYKTTVCDSVLSVVKNGHFIWNEKGESLNYNYKNRRRRQDTDAQYAENGAFYISKIENILEHKNRLTGKISLSIMPKHTALELDDTEDWIIGEKIMETLVLPTLK